MIKTHPKIPTKDCLIAVRVTTEMRQRLDRHCAHQNHRISDVITKVLREYLAQTEPTN